MYIRSESTPLSFPLFKTPKAPFKAHRGLISMGVAGHGAIEAAPVAPYVGGAPYVVDNSELVDNSDTMLKRSK
jgi:hypothetical protein